MQIHHYLTSSGRDAFQIWLDGLADLKARVAILRRVDRLALGHFGDQKFLREGVRELRVDLGPGYRIYFAMVGSKVVVLLGGGSKQDQSADINRAIECLKDYRRRS
jgi:putative addiction module killer protein